MGVGARIIEVLDLFSLIFCIAFIQFRGDNGDSNSGCRESERIALLKFKQGLVDSTESTLSYLFCYGNMSS